MLRGGAAFLHNCLTDCQRTDDLADGVVSSRPKYFPKWLSHGRYYLLIFRERVTQFSTLALTRVGRWCRLQSFRREWFSTPLDTNVTFLFSSFSNFFFPIQANGWSSTRARISSRRFWSIRRSTPSSSAYGTCWAASPGTATSSTPGTPSPATVPGCCR